MEIGIIFSWYALFVLFGIIGLPFTNYFFKNWVDKGYGLAKFVGLFFVAFPIWFLASLKIITFSREIVVMSVFLALIGSIYWLVRVKFDWLAILKYVILHELVFFVLILIWGRIRSMLPRIEGTEKMMNLAFMNSIARSEYFPPADPWYAGGTINYYYLGHYLFTFAAKFLNLGMNYGYNLTLITIIAHTFTSLLSIFLQLFRKKQGWSVGLGLLGATWICFASNLHYPIKYLAAVFSGKEFKYFFPDPTRIVPFAIDEFPAYSIVLGDVHGHYLGLPFFTIAIALVLANFKLKLGSREKYFFNLIVSPLIIAMYGINSWDLISVLFMFTLFTAYQFYISSDEVKQKVKQFFLTMMALVLPGLLLMVPYIINFDAPVQGEGKYIIDKYIGFVPTFLAQHIDSFKLEDPVTKESVPYHKTDDIIPWLQMWGMFLFITVSFYLVSHFKGLKQDIKIKTVSLLGITAFCLVLGVEFFFLKDIFHTDNPPYYRTNTVFKFYYHAWIVWGIAATWFVYHLIFNSKGRFYSLVIPLLSVILLMWIGTTAYIFRAIKDFYPKYDPVVATLDGMKYIEREADKVGDYEAINWLNDNVEGQVVIAEAVGDAYTYYARITTNTGLITVMGWPTHEWQWRGEATTAFDRADQMRLFYTTTDSAEIAKTIAQYDIEYIIVGELERTKYPELNTKLIEQIAQVVYQNETTKIYKVK